MKNTILILFQVLLFGGVSNATDKSTVKSEDQFNRIINVVQSLYAPLVEASRGSLIISKLWDSDVMNGFADREETQWIVRIHGGFFRHDKVTEDGLTALVCHELGHHLGGPPFKSDIPWMSSEGQADFYAAEICMRKVWGQDDNLKIIRHLDVPTFLSEQCAKSYFMEADSALCIRIAMAGYSFIEFNRVEHGYSSESVPVSFESPAAAGHGPALTYPRAQCRLDTFLAGALLKSRPACWFY